MNRPTPRFPRTARLQHGRIAPQTLAILLVALAAGIGLWAGQRWFGAAGHAAPPELQGALAYPQPRPLQAFELQQANGSSLTPGDFAGHWTLVFIGFTHCPDVCPTTLAQLAQALKGWDGADAPRVLFVSVDPERDSAARAGEYAAWFDPRFLGATGTHEQLEPFARNLGLVYMQSPLEQSTPAAGPAAAAPPAAAVAPDANAVDAAPADAVPSDAVAAEAPAGEGDAEPYTVDHSASVAVIDPDARLVAVLRPPFDPAIIRADLQALAEARR